VSIASKPKIIVAAIASRAYVKAAAEAGFEVVAIDAFVDADTQRLANQCYQIDFFENQLDNNQLLKVLDGLDLQQFIGFCYGAGFEKTPSILSQINKRIPIIGNTAQNVGKCKAANIFFKICDELNIAYPPTMYELPSHLNGWVQKEIGGSGGGHIKQLSDKQEIQVNNVYYQKIQEGKPISCLFLANESGVQVVGISEQWLDVNDVEPFRYGGAVSHAEITERAKMRLIDYVSKLSQAIGLVGINSCDAICDGDDVYVLEVNPRLSATVDLYVAEQPNLIAAHVAASQSKLGEDVFKKNNLNKKSAAHQVIYAQYEVTIGDNMSWPVWARDVPRGGSCFRVGMPICTVFSEADTALLARKLVQDKAIELKNKLLN
jgi:uncharacterized protein